MHFIYMDLYDIEGLSPIYLIKISSVADILRMVISFESP